MEQTKTRICSRQDAKNAKSGSCHFDRREKSFLVPSDSLGMTGLSPSLCGSLAPLRTWSVRLCGSDSDLVAAKPLCVLCREIEFLVILATSDRMAKKIYASGANFRA